MARRGCPTDCAAAELSHYIVGGAEENASGKWCRVPEARYSEKEQAPVRAGACSEIWLLGGFFFCEGNPASGVRNPFMGTVVHRTIPGHYPQEKTDNFAGAYGKTRLQTVLARHPAVAELRPTAAKLYWLLWGCAGGVETRRDGQQVLKLRRRYDWHPNKDGELVEGLAQLMGFQGTSASVVKRLSVWVRKLKQGGLIEVKSTGRSPIIYILVPPMVPGVEVERVRNSEVRLPQDSEVRLPRKSEVRLPQNSEVHYAESSVRVFMQSHDAKNPLSPSSKTLAQVEASEADNQAAEGEGAVRRLVQHIRQQAAKPPEPGDIDTMLQEIRKAGCDGVTRRHLDKGRWTLVEVRLVVGAAGRSKAELYDSIVTRDEAYINRLIEAEARQIQAHGEAVAAKQEAQEESIRVNKQISHEFIAVLRDKSRSQAADAEASRHKNPNTGIAYETAEEFAAVLQSRLEQLSKRLDDDAYERESVAVCFAELAELAGLSRKSIAAIEQAEAAAEEESIRCEQASSIQRDNATVNESVAVLREQGKDNQADKLELQLSEYHQAWKADRSMAARAGVVAGVAELAAAATVAAGVVQADGGEGSSDAGL